MLHFYMQTIACLNAIRDLHAEVLAKGVQGLNFLNTNLTENLHK